MLQRIREYLERVFLKKGVHVRRVQGCTHDRRVMGYLGKRSWDCGYTCVILPLIPVVIGLGRGLRQLDRIASKILVSVTFPLFSYVLILLGLGCGVTTRG